MCWNTLDFMKARQTEGLLKNVQIQINNTQPVVEKSNTLSQNLTVHIKNLKLQKMKLLPQAQELLKNQMLFPLAQHQKQKKNVKKKILENSIKSHSIHNEQREISELFNDIKFLKDGCETVEKSLIHRKKVTEIITCRFMRCTKRRLITTLRRYSMLKYSRKPITDLNMNKCRGRRKHH